MKRLGHLLDFELKRIKWLIVAAWVFMAMAFMPRLLGAIGRWDVEWHNSEEFLAVSGMTGFGLAGFFLAVWSGTLGRRLYQARPVSLWEMVFVSWGVMLVVLVLPVLFLTAFTMWLYGFDSEIIIMNSKAMALSTFPLWWAVRCFARYGGSLRVAMLGMVAVGGLIFLGGAFEYRDLYQPWGNFFGTWVGEMRWVAPTTTAVILSFGWLVAKRWSTSLRMSCAVVAVILGWSAHLWAGKREKESLLANELPVKVKITGEVEGYSSSGGKYLKYEESPGTEDEFWLWEVADELRDGEGRSYENPRQSPLRDSGGRIEQAHRRQITKTILGETGVYLDQSTTTQSRRGRAAINQQSPQRILVKPPAGGLPANQIVLSGNLVGKRCQVDTIFKNLPKGEISEFRMGDAVGEMSWVGGTEAREPEQLRLVVSEPSVSGRPTESTGWSRHNWLVVLKYPKAGVTIEGDSRNTGMDVKLGGVVRWVTRYEFNHSEKRFFDFGEEVPLVSVFRIRIEELGVVDVESDSFWFGRENREGTKYYQSVLEGGSFRDGPPWDELWAKRPSPKAGSREDVGGWFRKITRLGNYDGRNHDLSQFADGWGDLFWQTKRFSRGYNGIGIRPFFDGAPDRWREEAIDALGGVSEAAETLMERGWAEAAREKVEELIAQGNRDPEVLRLALYLELEGVREVVLQTLVESSDPRLYFAAKESEWVSDGIEEILDQRLVHVEEMTRKRWSVDPGNFRFPTKLWLWLLHEGRRGDLERCLEWMQKVKGGRDYRYEGVSWMDESLFGEVLFDADRFAELLRAGLLKGELFQWDPIFRKWIFNREGQEE